MLGSKRKRTPEVNNNAVNSAQNAATCVISQGTKIVGEFSAIENVRLDGEIEGDVTCKQRIVMGETGRIKGKIIAADAIIMGKIDGELIVSNTIHLKGTANINGIITGKSMTVDEGAVYSGECRVGAKAVPA